MDKISGPTSLMKTPLTSRKCPKCGKQIQLDPKIVEEHARACGFTKLEREWMLQRAEKWQKQKALGLKGKSQKSQDKQQRRKKPERKPRTMTDYEFRVWMAKERARREQDSMKEEKVLQGRSKQDLWDIQRPYSGGGGPGTGKRR